MVDISTNISCILEASTFLTSVEVGGFGVLMAHYGTSGWSQGWDGLGIPLFLVNMGNHRKTMGKWWLFMGFDGI